MTVLGQPVRDCLKLYMLSLGLLHVSTFLLQRTNKDFDEAFLLDTRKETGGNLSRRNQSISIRPYG
jgi:hypothetical protein